MKLLEIPYDTNVVSKTSLILQGCKEFPSVDGELACSQLGFPLFQWGKIGQQLNNPDISTSYSPVYITL